ncbi:hypothetical protein FHS27_002114 [Rhodopirellula rubra]|uniref:PEP-CTERM protein-sorting domain-containing protein n=1 Tax=Aporhodopirellula rubra TaxID=980271 RepID=A0A7W5H5V0_9BACT|nr:hypothetical protein [Aporhodopirellula rubra]MBB3206305.1 hypothetical protein [Aporhodopirellula rubra]
MLSVVCWASPAQAILVTYVPGNNVLGGNASVNSVSIDNTAKTIGIDLSFLQLHQPIQLGFNAQAELSTPPFVAETYTVTLTSTNLASHPMNGFDASVGGFAGTLAGSVNTPLTSNSFAIEPQPPTTFVRIGGLNGGGGQIVPGQTAISSFALSLANFGAAGNSSNFTIGLTANPEPATLLLGAMVTVPGVIAARRRRRRKAVTQAQPALA